MIKDVRDVVNSLRFIGKDRFAFVLPEDEAQAERLIDNPIQQAIDNAIALGKIPDLSEKERKELELLVLERELIKRGKSKLSLFIEGWMIEKAVKRKIRKHRQHISKLSVIK